MARHGEIHEDHENREAEAENRERDRTPGHFESTYELKCSENYDANGYRYKTDERGRITRCEGTLRLQETKANPAHQREAGGEDRRETDDGGHLIARRFGGSERVDNLVAMDRHLNRSEYKKMENDWDKALKSGKEVQTDIRVKYREDSQRPSQVYVASRITDAEGNSETKIYRFKNESEQYAPQNGGRTWEGDRK